MGTKKFVIIVAGGSGSRMQSEIPKQFLPLGRKTILEHTVAKFLEHDNELRVVVVIPEKHEQHWSALSVSKEARVARTYGGATRYHSVTNGLKCLEAQEGDLVAIHDGVRPLLSNALIERCYNCAAQEGSAIPGTEVVETLRKFSDPSSQSKWVNREEYRAIQTPQTFKYEILRNAYDQPFSERFTDDASVVEACGIRVNLVEGERNNLKITTPEDFKLAQLLIGE